MPFTKISKIQHSVMTLFLCASCFTSVCSVVNTCAAQEKCEKQLADAERKYFTGRFDEAINLAGLCLTDGGPSDAERLRAYRLIGLSYIAKDYLEQAKNAVEKLLKLVPTFEPDPNQDPPEFARMVIEMKQAISAQQKTEEQPPAPVEPTEPVQPAKKGGSKKWLWIGGGVGVVVAAVIFAGSRGDKPPDTPVLLPEPPPLPANR